MKIIIEGNPKEIAAFVFAVQKRLGEDYEHEYICKDNDGELIMNPYDD